MLYYSSFAFSTIAIHAYFVREAIYNIGFTLLNGLSILNHSKMYNDNGTLARHYPGKTMIRIIDIVLAHSLTLFAIRDTLALEVNHHRFIVGGTIWYAAIVYYMKCMKQFDINNLYHVSIHLVSSMGMHILLYSKHSSPATKAI